MAIVVTDEQDQKVSTTEIMLESDNIKPVLLWYEKVYCFPICSISETLDRLAFNTNSQHLKIIDLQGREVVHTFYASAFDPIDATQEETDIKLFKKTQYYNNETDLAVLWQMRSNKSNAITQSMIVSFDSKFDEKILISSNQINGEIINWFVISPDGTNIVLLINYNKIKVFNIDNLYNSSSNSGPIECDFEIMLDESIKNIEKNSLTISSNNGYLAVTGGCNEPYFYVININSNEKRKLQSKELISTYSPIFFGKNDRYVAVASGNGKIQIWDHAKEQPIYCIRRTNGIIYSICFKNNVLLSTDLNGYMVGWDISDIKHKNVKLVFKKRFRDSGLNLEPDSALISQSFKYINVSGVVGGSGIAANGSPLSLSCVFQVA